MAKWTINNLEAEVTPYEDDAWAKLSEMMDLD